MELEDTTVLSVGFFGFGGLKGRGRGGPPELPSRLMGGLRCNVPVPVPAISADFGNAEGSRYFIMGVVRGRLGVKRTFPRPTLRQV